MGIKCWRPFREDHHFYGKFYESTVPGYERDDLTIDRNTQRHLQMSGAVLQKPDDEDIVTPKQALQYAIDITEDRWNGGKRRRDRGDGITATADSLKAQLHEVIMSDFDKDKITRNVESRFKVMNDALEAGELKRARGIHREIKHYIKNAETEYAVELDALKRRRYEI